MMKRPFS
jgi:hypothetical protein